MKIAILPLILIGAVLTLSLPQSGRADDTSTPAAGAPSPERMEKIRAALQKLDLTDAQKAQIKQIRSTVTDRKERIEQIMAVLTPDQKAKLRQMIQEHRNAAGTASSAT